MRVALLWHMHQPDYRRPETGEEALPWVRLHALKNYYDMARLVEEAPPGLHVTFNLTPSLLLQLEQLVRRGPADPLYRLCRRPVSQLSPDERDYLQEHLFDANEERAILPLPRYRQLLEARRSGRSLTEQELLDAEVLFHLAWSGRTLREDPLLRELLARGRDFGEAERDALLDLQDAFLGRVLPTYRRLWEEGRVEISTSPLHHPILPLLADIGAAEEANPSLHLEALDFRFPEDAREQLRRGLAAAEELLGRRPRGLWPSEGSLSERSLRFLEEEGLAWAATDQGVLEASLDLSGLRPSFPPHLRPWRRRGSRCPALFFRDTEISDRIGFTYSRVEADEAVGDLLRLLRARLAEDPQPEQAVLSIVLDGENAWEYYPENGVPFLQGLYRALAGSGEFRTVTFSQALEEVEPQWLPRLRAGSWIGARLDTWVGHPEKNRAWELLSEARRELDDRLSSGELPAERAEEARRLLLQAEGSDWFWWLGDDHPSPQKPLFEGLFRELLRAAWRAMGRVPPSSLHRPISAPPPEGPPALLQPSALLEPRIDGEPGSYFDWLGAGRLELVGEGGALHLGRRVFRSLDFGFDARRLYLRLTPRSGRAEDHLRGGTLSLHLLAGDSRWQLVAGEDGRLLHGDRPAGRWAAATVLELAAELAELGIGEGPLAFHLELLRPDAPAERVPLHGEVGTRVPGPDFDAWNWSV